MTRDVDREDAVHDLIHMSVHVSTHISAYMSIHMSMHISIYMPMQMSIHKSIYMSTCMAIHVYTRVHTHVCSVVKTIGPRRRKHEHRHAYCMGVCMTTRIQANRRRYPPEIYADTQIDIADMYGRAGEKRMSVHTSLRTSIRAPFYTDAMPPSK